MSLSLSAIASKSLYQAYEKLDSRAAKVAEKGLEIEDAVGIKTTEKQAQVAAKLLKIEDRLQDSLLDILV